MELHELKSSIVSKNRKPLYIFTGPEVAIMDVYIKKISDMVGYSIKRMDTVGVIYSKLQSKGFITENSCYYVRDDKEFTTMEKIWPTFEAELGNSTMILVYQNIDKRSKFYKYYQDSIVEFEKLTTPQLAKYIMKDIGLAEHYGMQLANICDCDYSRILLECDKLKLYAKALKDEDMKRVFLNAFNAKLFYQPPGDVIFDMVDALARRNIKLTWELYQELKEAQEPPVKIVSIIYNTFRQILLVQGCGDESGLVEKTGLTAWQCTKAKEKVGYYNLGEIVATLKLTRQVEKGIKTGAIDPDMAIDYLLNNILGRK